MPERPEERFAFEVLRRALGADVKPYDDGSQPAMVDGLFELPNGESGAVEVTTVGSQKALELEHTLEREISIPGGRWGWHVAVPFGVRLSDLRRHLVPLLLACEAHGLGDPDMLTPEPALLEAYEWYTRCGFFVHALPDARTIGRALLVAGIGAGGAIPEDLTGFAEWLGSRLATDRFIGERQKLANSGRLHRHLFLRIHESWLPFGFDSHVAWEPTLPKESLRLPTEITAVWLGTRWARPMLWWDDRDGWQRFDVGNSSSVG